MSRRTIGRAAVLGAVGLLAMLAAPGAGRAGTMFKVAPGYELLDTKADGSSFPGLGSLAGVPLTTFNFGNGAVKTGNTDTILQRTGVAAPANIPNPFPDDPTKWPSATVNLKVLALQVMATMMVDYMNNGKDTYYITLDPNKASTGTQTITWGPSGLSGTFATTLDLNLVIRKGGLNGKIVDTLSTTLKGSDVWSDIAPKDAIKITGVNQFLSGTKGDVTQDFWQQPPLQQIGPGFQDKLQDASPSPEPSGLILGACGLVGLGGFARRRRP
ncbi:MAG TPA: hypothetical protein VG406_02645 [Isosphaeraceae bacterium]|jgi:hypothetical protein|nr:hypothetical protein [Isosphaeraceae bacterium]